MMCFFVVLVVNSAIYSAKILAYSLQVCSPQQGVLIILLAYAHEIFMISTEEKE